jgi:hypothetical protein
MSENIKIDYLKLVGETMSIIKNHYGYTRDVAETIVDNILYKVGLGDNYVEMSDFIEKEPTKAQLVIKVNKDKIEDIRDKALDNYLKNKK